MPRSAAQRAADIRYRQRVGNNYGRKAITCNLKPEIHEEFIAILKEEGLTASGWIELQVKKKMEEYHKAHPTEKSNYNVEPGDLGRVSAEDQLEGIPKDKK